MLANEQAVVRGELPDFEDAIRAGVKWRPEPFVDGEHFDLGHQVVRRGWGDCDDLAPWLAGHLRATGEDEGARPRVYKTGKDRWHVVVQMSDGKILDPSKWAGMGKRSAPSSKGVSGTVARPFARTHGGALVCMPHGGHWWARCDVPWPDGSGHVASHGRARTPNEALERAVSGAIVCGEEIDSPLVDRARGCAEMLLADADELRSDAEVGSIFGKIFKVVKTAANPMSLINPLTHAAGLPNLDPVSALKGPAGQAAANMLVPGAGGKLHDMGTSMLDHLTHGGGRASAPGAIFAPGGSGAVSVPMEHLQQGGAPEEPAHGQHMFLYYHPKGHPGPVVMRF